AGIPATAGFLAKFYVVDAGASTANWALVLILVITSVIGLFYYLRIVVTMYAPVPEEIQVPTSLHPGSYVLIALTVLLLWFGIYPVLFLCLLRTDCHKLTLRSPIRQTVKGDPTPPLCANAF